MLEKILIAFKRHKVKYAICGGFAVVIQGVVRGTMDLDVVIDLSKNQLAAAEAALKELGFISRIPVTAKEIHAFRSEYIKNRNLLAWSFYNEKNPLEVVDILLIDDVSDFEVEQKNFRGLKLNVLSIDSLIKQKRKSGRPQDKIDVEALKTIKTLLKGRKP